MDSNADHRCIHFTLWCGLWSVLAANSLTGEYLLNLLDDLFPVPYFVHMLIDGFIFAGNWNGPILQILLAWVKTRWLRWYLLTQIKGTNHDRSRAETRRWMCYFLQEVKVSLNWIFSTYTCICLNDCLSIDILNVTVLIHLQFFYENVKGIAYCEHCIQICFIVIFPILNISLIGMVLKKNHIYHKISNIRCTKFQNWNVSRLGLHLTLHSILKPGVKWRMKM